MARPRPEWIAKHDGMNIPPRVRQRVYDRDGGVCHICKLPIKTGETWQADHVTALINGGEHRETNLAPAHSHCHVGKTAQDVKEKAKVAKVRGKHTGAIRPKQAIKSAPFPKADKSPRIDKSALPPLSRPQLYRSVSR
ncbi:HNH endonuclease [Pseudaminobacter salicylatoxidans]|uniref:HNH endonuclease n=1 Tax=Pseudaminobacter salicylatoxidans TaxID=93369 RepID=UPI00035D2C7F|nr:HNH endonuclease signature motif containing protein [Pseudaminobacter salicylatoxidans]